MSIRYDKVKKNIIILKILDYIIDAQRENYILSIYDLPKYVIDYFNKYQLDDYLSIYEIYVINNSKYRIDKQNKYSITVLGNKHNKRYFSILPYNNKSADWFSNERIKIKNSIYYINTDLQLCIYHFSEIECKVDFDLFGKETILDKKEIIKNLYEELDDKTNIIWL